MHSKTQTTMHYHFNAVLLRQCTIYHFCSIYTTVAIRETPELPLPSWYAIDWKHNRKNYWIVNVHECLGAVIVANASVWESLVMLQERKRRFFSSKAICLLINYLLRMVSELTVENSHVVVRGLVLGSSKTS